jgi:D-psicose/D-tagatose/L-ribulose 3-epimerase
LQYYCEAERIQPHKEHMKFGVNTFIWSSQFADAEVPLLPAIKSHGFDGVEVPLFRPTEFKGATIRRATEANGLEVTICCVLVPGFSLISDDVDERRRSQQHLLDCIKASADAGARLMAGPVYCPVGYLPGRRRTESEWKRAIEAYQLAGDALDAHDVTLAIEPLNRFETFFLNTAADASRLAAEVGHPRVGVLFDTFHANIEEKDIANGFRAVGGHLKHVHTCENDRGIPGSGHVDWPGVRQALSDVGYDGWLTIESFGFALGDLSAAAAIWRDIESSPDAIAFEGIKFLRQWAQAHSRSS